MATKPKIVLKWGVAIHGGTKLLTFDSRASARVYYKNHNAVSAGSAKRPFKIYVEV